MNPPGVAEIWFQINIPANCESVRYSSEFSTIGLSLQIQVWTEYR